MDDIARTMVAVRADTLGFAQDVAAMRRTLEEGMGTGAARAGGLIEAALARAVRTGKLGFEDLKATALGVLDQIAAAAVRAGVSAAFGGNATPPDAAGGGGWPGRATGGPVTAGRAYRVGERGPELFVPAGDGRIEAATSGAGAVGTSGVGREVRVAITINAPAGDGAGVLRQSSRQVARAVRAALAVE